jgi:hypothetical protein
VVRDVRCRLFTRETARPLPSDEGRHALSRRDKILRFIDVPRQSGIEFGPLITPVVARANGDIRYVDRASTEELRHWFSADDKINTAEIASIDYIWNDAPLLDCVQNNQFDYAIASHVIEHVPDIVTWLNEVSDVLVDNGILSLIIPDKRYTFDCRRELSTMSDVIDAYVRRLRKPSPRQIFDHFAGIADVDTAGLWNGSLDPAHARLIHTPESVLQTVKKAYTSDEYIDSHCWVVTPHSFFKVLDGLNQLGLLNFEVVSFDPTELNDIEFFVSLRRFERGSSATRNKTLFQQSVEDPLRLTSL